MQYIGLVFFVSLVHIQFVYQYLSLLFKKIDNYEHVDNINIMLVFYLFLVIILIVVVIWLHMFSILPHVILIILIIIGSILLYALAILSNIVIAFMSDGQRRFFVSLILIGLSGFGALCYVIRNL